MLQSILFLKLASSYLWIACFQLANFSLKVFFFLLVGTMVLNECLVCVHGLFWPLITFSAYLICLRPSSPFKTGICFLFWPLRYNLLACIYSRPSHLSCDSFAAFLHCPIIPYSWLVPIPACGVLWIWAKNQTLSHPLGQHAKYACYHIWLRVHVNLWTITYHCLFS